MADYVMDGDDPSLFPDEDHEYAIVVMDEFKAPDDDDFIYRSQQFEDDDFDLPVEKEGYTYYVHTADGETMTRDEWEGDE